jgi:hypothetical protein
MNLDPTQTPIIPAVASAAVAGIFIAVGVEDTALGNPAVERTTRSPLKMAAELFAFTWNSRNAPVNACIPIFCTGIRPYGVATEDIPYSLMSLRQPYYLGVTATK